MTDIATSSKLKPGTPQLPVSAYFDQAVFERELKRLFDGGPQYVGHELQVPNPGDFQTVAWMEHRKMLVRNGQSVALLGNVCRHRQALMMEGRGRIRNVVCPAHHWTYDLDGRLIGAPEFAETPCTALENTPLQNWQGLLFAGPRDVVKDLGDFPLAADYDFSGYLFDKAIVDECPYNWKNFLEIFLELYHVVPVHPGLQKFVDPGNFKWGFGDCWSYQIMGLKDELRFQHSQHYAKYRDAILAYSGGKLPKYGTVWALFYPNVMVEWYPYSLVISYLVPRSPEHTLNVVEFYYPEDIALFERTIVDAHQAAYAESAAEDMHVCQLLHKGRKALYAAGREDFGPYQSPLEDGMVHFHQWWRREMGVSG